MKHTFTGHVTDTSGEPLVGAHITTVMEPKRGTITDFDGNFKVSGEIGEAFQVGHIGKVGRIFRIDRFANTGKFILKDNAFELDEVVLRPRKKTVSPAAPKKGLLDLIADNPVTSLTFGAIGIWAILTITTTTTN